MEMVERLQNNGTIFDHLQIFRLRGSMLCSNFLSPCTESLEKRFCDLGVELALELLVILIQDLILELEVGKVAAPLCFIISHDGTSP